MLNLPYAKEAAESAGKILEHKAIMLSHENLTADDLVAMSQDLSLIASGLLQLAQNELQYQDLENLIEQEPV